MAMGGMNMPRVMKKEMPGGGHVEYGMGGKMEMGHGGDMARAIKIYLMKKGGKTFPDLTGDGKVTFADILKGRLKKKSQAYGGKVMEEGGINEYGEGGNIYAQNGVAVPDSDQDQPSGRSFKPGEAFMMSGFENQPDAEGMVSGRERMYVVMPGSEGQGPRSLDLRSAAKEFGYDNAAAMARAMGVETQRNPAGGLTFSSTTDPAYNKRLQEAFGSKSLEDVQSKLGIGRVSYSRERDLPNIVRAAAPGGRQFKGGRVRFMR